MIVAPHPDTIRAIVFQTLLEFDVEEDVLADLDERILLDDGKYIARSYQVEGFMAMWLIDAGIIQFYDDDGNMLRTVNLFEEVLPRRVAA